MSTISRVMRESGSRRLRRGRYRLGRSSLLVALLLPLSGRGVGLVAQGREAMAPLPAEPPIGGMVWTVVIPAVLLLGSFLGTYLLYRRFSRVEGE